MDLFDFVNDEPEPPPDTGAEGLEARFQAYHREHPEVYREFRQAAEQLLCRGIRHYGAKAIMEVVRFHRAVSGEGPGEPFKINNNYTSRYARLLQSDDPRFSEFFETRELKT